MYIFININCFSLPPPPFSLLLLPLPLFLVHLCFCCYCSHALIVDACCFNDYQCLPPLCLSPTPCPAYSPSPTCNQPTHTPCQVCQCHFPFFYLFFVLWNKSRRRCWWCYRRNLFIYLSIWGLWNKHQKKELMKNYFILLSFFGCENKNEKKN